MAMHDYEEEVKNHLTSNIFKIAVPIITPLYLFFNISDWFSYPSLALEFLYVRLLIVPFGALCLWALKRKWRGPWHAYTIWICACVISCQMTYMAARSGSLSVSPYLYSINLITAILLFLFPMQTKRNLITLLIIYAPPAMLFISRIETHTPDNLSMALMALYAIVIIIFSIAATAVDKLRYKTFQQKVSLFYMATTDALSGLKLRRYFFNRFVQELSLRIRKPDGVALSVAMFDIDSFKEINDKHGHEFGDRVIRHIGEIIRKSIRIYDVACRYGGEEFAIFFPETKPEEAMVVSERIRKALESSPIKGRGGEVRVTVSGGVSGTVAKVPDELRQALMGMDKKTVLIKHMLNLVREADAALYEAKKRDKNCVRPGKAVDFSMQFDADEISTVKSYLPYFDDAMFQLLPEEAMQPAEPPDSFFYAEEYFFRRCVEGLYRWSRDNSWREVLAIITVDHTNQELVKRQFHKIFRLADVTSVLGEGIYGVLFYEMPQWALERVLDRIKRQLAQVMHVESVPVKIAASPLQFDSSDKPAGNPSYPYFAKKATGIFNKLKQHRFGAKESIYYFETATVLPAVKA